MITLIIKSYLSILLSIGGSALFVFLLGLFFIFKKPAQKQPKQSEAKQMDFTEIAGEDVITTQLDLARAFLETGNAHSAKSILNSVIAQGNPSQQEEAKRLLTSVA